MKTAEEKHTELYRKILEILKSNFYPLGEADDDAQCAEMIAKFVEEYFKEPAKDIPLSAKRTAEGIMPSAITIWKQANDLSEIRFDVWLQPYLKELEKYTEK